MLLLIWDDKQWYKSMLFIGVKEPCPNYLHLWHRVNFQLCIVTFHVNIEVTCQHVLLPCDVNSTKVCFTHFHVFTWNPCTRKFKILPPLKNIHSLSSNTIHTIWSEVPLDIREFYVKNHLGMPNFRFINF